jgi:hypothetical protein
MGYLQRGAVPLSERVGNHESRCGTARPPRAAGAAPSQARWPPGIGACCRTAGDLREFSVTCPRHFLETIEMGIKVAL